MVNGFFYDGQIRRFLIQFVRIMSNFQVEFGKDAAGKVSLQQVPVYYGDSSQQVAQIIMGNSENALPTVPAMACYISAFQYDRARVQEPAFVSKMKIREREYNSTTGLYGPGQGDAFTIERMMPVPYKLTLKVDIWTSNGNQKMQLIEQMCPLFNPALEIQSTDNYVDWTSLSAIYLTDTSWDSRSVPTGANTLSIATLTFELPIWLSLPAKVKKLGVIERIVASIYDANGDLINDIAGLPDATILSQKIITPLSYGVVYYNNTIQLFLQGNNTVTETVDAININGSTSYSWATLAELYGSNIKNGITQLRLEQDNGSTVVGTVSQHPSNTSMLLFTPFADTIPANTVTAITAIIDPHNTPILTYSGAVAGTRYLILSDIGPTDAWGNLTANANDIIQFDGVTWTVDFNSATETQVKYCTNLKSGIQFKWLPEIQTWQKSTEGSYAPGNWTIVL